MNKKVIFALLLVTFVLAITLTTSKNIDDVAVYSKQDKVFSIKDNFGYGKEIARAELKSHKTVDEIKQVRIGKDVPVMRYDITGDVDIGEIEFINNKNNKDTSRPYKLIRIDYQNKTVPVVNTICDNPKDKDDCTTEILRYETVSEERRSNFDGNLDSGTTTLELVVDVYKGDYIDGIWSFNGIKASRHASWNASFETDLLAVWDFNQTGATQKEVWIGHYNLTQSGSPTLNVSTSVLPNGFNVPNAGTGLFARTGSQDILGGKNGTMIMWLQSEDPQTSTRNWWSTDDVSETRLGTSANNIQFTVNGVNVILTSTQTYFNVGQMMMVTATWDTQADVYKFYINDTLWITSTTVSSDSYDSGIYIGGSSTGARQFEGNITDVKLYNRTLSQGEISQHYNNGLGLQFLPAEVPYISVTSTSPNDLVEKGSLSTIFYSANYDTNNNLTNGTVRIFNSTDGLVTSNFTQLRGSTNSTNLSLSNVPTGVYRWNVYACSNKTNGGVLCGESNNRTISFVSLTINNESFNNITTGGQSEFFQINLSTYGGYSVTTANLIYNGSSYAGSITNPSGSIYSISRTLTVPNVPASINKSFFWNIILSNGMVENTTIHNQTIQKLAIDNCTTNTFVIYNFTMYDENSQTIINQNTFFTFGRVDLSLYNSLNGSLVTNFSANYTKTNPFYVCLNINLTGSQTYKIDTLVQYGAQNYTSEFYNIQQDTLSQSTLDRRISLYDLDTSSTTEFKLTYKDSSFNVVPNALVILQRKYIDQGVFKTVEIPKTDTNGQALLHLKVSDTLYNIIITKNGNVLATFYNLNPKCQNAVLGECNLNLNELLSSISPKSYTTVNDISFSMTYNYTSREESIPFVITTGNSATVSLNVTALYTNSTYLLLCQDSQLLSSGTLSCSIPLTYNGTAIAKLYKDGVQVGEQIILNIGSQTNRQTFGGNLVFLSLFLMLMFIGIGISDNPIILGMMLILGTIVSTAFNLIANTGFIGYGATILFFIISIIVIMVKGARR